MRVRRKQHKVIISLLVIYSVLISVLCFSKSTNIDKTFVPVSTHDIIKYKYVVYETDVNTEYGKIKKGTVVIVTDTHNVTQVGNNLVIKK